MEWVDPAGGLFSWTRNYRHWCGHEDVVHERSLHYLAGNASAVVFEAAFGILAGGAAAGRLVTGEVVAAETAALVPATTDAAAVAARGGAQAVRVGQAGEAAVRNVADIGEKVLVRVGGRGRIPDGLTSTVLSEVKKRELVELHAAAPRLRRAR